MLPLQTNERPVHVWQLISLAGGKQLDTANGGWRRSDVKSMRQSCICDQEGLCESISKIIHFAVATHFRLPVPIMDLSGEGDRAGPWCGVRPLLFNLSSTPWRPPPSQLSSLHMLLHFLPYSSDPHQSSSAAAVCIKKKGGPHCYSACPLLSLWGLAVITLTHTKTLPNQ